VGAGALAPGLHAPQLPVPLVQVGVGLLVGLTLPLGLAGVAFAVGGTVGGLPGDLVGLLGLIGLLSCPGQVASPQQSPWAVVEGGDQILGLLAAGGRLGQPLLGLLASGGRMRQQPRLVARREAATAGGG
jgi:hypothetical protein